MVGWSSAVQGNISVTSERILGGHPHTHFPVAWPWKADNKNSALAAKGLMLPF